MAELQERETKLIQYLNEAYAKEQELVTALQAHISLTSRDAYKKRLKDHLKETKAQAKGLERRIKQLGGKAEKIDLPGPDAVSAAAGKAQSAAQKAVAAAKGPMHALRGTGEAEKMLKNAKTEFWNEHDEIANYLSIETLAKALGDRDTEKLAREFRKQEERMVKFLERTISALTKEVVREEVPAAQRNGGRKRATSRARATASSRKAAATRSSGSSSRASSSRSSSGTKAASSRAKSSSSRGKSTTSGAKSTSSRGKSTATRAKAASTRSTSARAKSSSSSSRAKSSSNSSRSRSGSSSSRAKAGSSSRSRAKKS